MNNAFSIYLDLVRFLAAFLVYLYHSNQRRLIEDILPASQYGHSSVIVFFVLSGFVIAFVTDQKEKQWITYAASRLSRVYSVALPAVALTIMLDCVGRWLYPEIYNYPFDQFFFRTLGSLLMLNEIWFFSITSFSNVPYWSITYEFWYYVFFALFVFLPRKTACLSLLLISVLIGPKIILLAPLWGLGVILYHHQGLRTLSLNTSVFMVLISGLLIIFFHVYDLEKTFAVLLKNYLGATLHAELTFSKFFLSDYILAVLVFFHFAGMRQIAPLFSKLFKKIEIPIRFLANHTFTLYLMHQPLFLFWTAVVRGDPHGHIYWWKVTILVMVSVLLISHFTENKRHQLRDRIKMKLLSLEEKLSQFGKRSNI